MFRLVFTWQPPLTLQSIIALPLLYARLKLWLLAYFGFNYSIMVYLHIRLQQRINQTSLKASVTQAQKIITEPARLYSRLIPCISWRGCFPFSYFINMNQDGLCLCLSIYYHKNQLTEVSHYLWRQLTVLRECVIRDFVMVSFGVEAQMRRAEPYCN